MADPVDLYRAFARLLGDKPFAFHPSLSKIAKDAKAGLMLNALAHWGFGKTAQKNDGWVYIPVAQMEQMTGLTEEEQRTARGKLEGLGLIECERRGHGGKWHYRLMPEQVAAALGVEDGDWDFSWDLSPDTTADEAPQPGEMLSRENPDKNKILSRENPDKKPALSRENPDAITVKESVKLNTQNVGAGAPAVYSPPPSTPGIKPGLVQNYGAFQALQSFENRPRDGLAAVVGYPEEVRPMAARFIEDFGRGPKDKREKGFWIKELQYQRDMGLTADDLGDAFTYMTQQQLTIKSPASLTNIAWDRKRKSSSPSTGEQAAASNGFSW